MGRARSMCFGIDVGCVEKWSGTRQVLFFFLKWTDQRIQTLHTHTLSLFSIMRICVLCPPKIVSVAQPFACSLSTHMPHPFECIILGSDKKKEKKEKLGKHMCLLIPLEWPRIKDSPNVLASKVWPVPLIIPLWIHYLSVKSPSHSPTLHDAILQRKVILSDPSQVKEEKRKTKPNG